MATHPTIALADDHEMIRQVVRNLTTGHYSIVYEAASAESLLRFLQANPATRHPAMALLDIEMGDMSGIEAIRKVKEINPSIKVIMLTSFDDDDKVFSAIRQGADAYIIKTDMDHRLLTCLQDVEAGGSYMSPGVARKAMQFMLQHTVPEPDAGNPLSTREIEILKLVISGETAADIAGQLFISATTVKTHIYNVYKKLQVTNKMEAANLVRSKGWV